MKFISDSIEHICNYHSDFSNVTIILPSECPILFFKREFKKKIFNGFLPQFTTISEFNQQFSGLAVIDGISLWINAYQIYLKKNPKQAFGDFLKWIPSVLNDFNDILLFSDHPQQLLEFMISIERLESWNLQFQLKNYKSAEENLFFWKKLAEFYKDLNEELLKKKLALPGMISRLAYKNILNRSDEIRGFYYFLGFNALSTFESKIIRHFIKYYKAQIIIEADEYYLKNQNQESGKFLREILSWNEINPKKINFIRTHFSDPKTIKQYPTSNSIMSAKILGNLLLRIPENEYKDTIIVLCDEKLLLPVIQSIPENIKKFNLTIGFSLACSSVSCFFLKLFEIKKIQSETQNQNKGIDLPDLQELLKNPIFSEKLQSKIESFFEQLKNKNLVFILNNEILNYFSDSPLRVLFDYYENIDSFIEALLNFTSYIIKYSSKNQINIAIFEAIKYQIIRFHRLLVQCNFNYDFQSLYLLFKQLIQEEKVNFIGQSLQGVQIMGILESQLLGFKNLIMLSVNESIIPKGRVDNSFIPFDVKSKFKINTFIDHDAIFAYHFYRLIQNSQNIHLVYENSDDKEKSRFIRQLEFESPHYIESVNFNFSLHSNLKSLISIEKKLFVQNKLNNWLKRGVSSFSLGTYLQNPIDFYKQYVLGIKEIDSIQKEISTRTMGILVHKVLENCYNNFIGKEIKFQDFDSIYNLVDVYLKNFIRELKISPLDHGFNYLNIQLARKMIIKIISFDKKLISEGNSLKILHLEHLFQTDFYVNQKYSVTLKGFIDRIDVLNGVTRIIDYKIISKKEYPLLESFKSDSNHSIQMLIYAFCCFHKMNLKELQVGVWGLNKINEGIKLMYYKINTQNKKNILQIQDLQMMLHLLQQLIIEIMNFEIPFLEKNKKAF